MVREENRPDAIRRLSNIEEQKMKNRLTFKTFPNLQLLSFKVTL